MKVTVENEFWELFPQAQISIMVAKGLDNSVDESKDPYFKSLLDKGSKRAEDFIVDETFTQNDVIQEWRGAFSKFKTKKGARSSIEALLKRVSQGREFNPINPLVDIIIVYHFPMPFLVVVKILLRFKEGCILEKRKEAKLSFHLVQRRMHQLFQKRLSIMIMKERFVAALTGGKRNGQC